jgi:hypothetical protein
LGILDDFVHEMPPFIFSNTKEDRMSVRHPVLWLFT